MGDRVGLCTGNRLRTVGIYGHEGTFGYMYWCPGCKHPHHVTVKQSPGRTGPVWGWNGDEANPTFSPSILSRWFELSDEGNRMITEKIPLPEGQTRYPGKDMVCHVFVENGKIRFLDDCTHELAGKTVDIPVWPTNSDWT